MWNFSGKLLSCLAERYFPPAAAANSFLLNVGKDILARRHALNKQNSTFSNVSHFSRLFQIGINLITITCLCKNLPNMADNNVFKVCFRMFWLAPDGQNGYLYYYQWRSKSIIQINRKSRVSNRANGDPNQNSKRPKYHFNGDLWQ